MWRSLAQTESAVKCLKTGVALVVFLLFAAPAPAQITRMWQTGLQDTPTTLLVSFGEAMFCYYDTADPITNYVCDVMSVNSKGETIIAGTAWIYFPPFHDQQNSGLYYPDDHLMCVVKFDSQGNKLWAYFRHDDAAPSTNHRARTAVLALGGDELGNVYCLSQFTYDFPNSHPVTMFKLAAEDGHELWRRTDPKVSVPSWVPTAMKVDAMGNATVSGFVAGQYEPYKQGRFVMRYDPDGQRLWYRKLPGDRYVVTDFSGTSQTLALTPHAGVVVVGAYTDRSFYPRGFAVKLDDKGRFSWLKLLAGPKTLPGFSSVEVGSRNTVCAAGPYGHAVFSPNGAVLNKNSMWPISGQVVATTARGGFILESGGVINAFSSTGHNQWWDSIGNHMLGMASLGNDQFVTVDKDLLFVKVDAANGNRAWWTWNTDYYPGHVTAVQGAPDGTIRLLIQENGITVAAYSIE